MQSVDVILIDRQHLRIVVNRLVVLAKFCKAIRPIVQGLDVVDCTILHLVSVVFYGVLEALHLAIDQAAVRVDYRVGCVKLDRLIEVVDGILEPTRVKGRLGWIMVSICMDVI